MIDDAALQAVTEATRDVGQTQEQEGPQERSNAAAAAAGGGGQRASGRLNGSGGSDESHSDDESVSTSVAAGGAACGHQQGAAPTSGSESDAGSYDSTQVDRSSPSRQVDDDDFWNFDDETDGQQREQQTSANNRDGATVDSQSESDRDMIAEGSHPQVARAKKKSVHDSTDDQCDNHQGEPPIQIEAIVRTGSAVGAIQ
jgi:hypothetical protein